MISQKELEGYARMAIKIIADLRQIGIPIAEDIPGMDYNARLRRCVARCAITKSSKMVYEGTVPKVVKNMTCRIEISDFFATLDEAEQRSIIAHELLHTCNGGIGHNAEFHRYADMLKAYGYNITDVYNGEIPDEMYRYIIKCEKCGRQARSITMTKIIKNINNYRCSVCGGNLIRVR